MNLSASETKKHIGGSVTKLLVWCLPTMALLFIGIFGIGLIPKMPSVVILIVIGFILSRLIFLLCSRRKLGIKVALFVLWLVILVIVGFFSLFLPWTLHRCVKADAQSKFEAKVSGLYPVTFAEPFEVGTVSSTEFHTFIDAFVFESKAYTLLCSYNDEEYQQLITSMEDRYRFRTEPIGTGCFDDKHLETKINPYTMIGDDCFRIFYPEDGDDFPFYKECLLVMKNDVEHQIAYIVFSNLDLDMADSLAEFIYENCGWKYIQT